MIFRLDDSVGCAALAGDVTVGGCSQLSRPSPGFPTVTIAFLEAPTGQRVLPCRFPCWRLDCSEYVRSLVVRRSVCGGGVAFEIISGDSTLFFVGAKKALASGDHHVTSRYFGVF